MYHIETQEKCDDQWLFSNRVSKTIGDGTDGLPLPDAITGLDDNDNGAGKTDAWEDPDYGEDNLWKYPNARSEKILDKLEAEYYYANDRSNNSGLYDNGEADVLDKIVTNI